MPKKIFYLNKYSVENDLSKLKNIYTWKVWFHTFFNMYAWVYISIRNHKSEHDSE